MKEIHLKPDWQRLYGNFSTQLSTKKMMQDGLSWSFRIGENLKTIITTRPEVIISVSEDTEESLKNLLMEYGIEGEFDNFMTVVHYSPNFDYTILYEKQKWYNDKVKKALEAYVNLMSPGEIKLSVNRKRIKLDSIFDEHITLATVKSLESRLSILQRGAPGMGLFIDLKDEAGRISLNKVLMHLKYLKGKKKPVTRSQSLRGFATAIFNFLGETSFGKNEEWGSFENYKLAFIGKFFLVVIPIFKLPKCKCEPKCGPKCRCKLDHTFYRDLGKSITLVI